MLRGSAGDACPRPARRSLYRVAALPAVAALGLLAGCTPIPAGQGPAPAPTPSSPDQTAPDPGSTTPPAPVPPAPIAPVPVPPAPGAPTSPYVPPPAPTGCPSDVAPVLEDYIHEGAEMTQIACNGEVAVYADAAALELPTGQTDWVEGYVTEMWQYFEQAYGACSVPRELPAQIGACEAFGSPKPLRVFLNATGGSGGGGTIATRFEERSGFNDTVSVGSGGFDESEFLRDLLAHEACHLVEGAGRGVEESPAFEVWGDSKWAEFCVYDLYQATGRTADAERLAEVFAPQRNLPPPGATEDVAWWTDWFYPLWVDGGGAPVMDRFFQLLSQHFPTSEQGTGELRYDRRMTVAEYVHFTSAALGVDLSERAAQAFNTAFDPDELERTRQEFPDLAYSSGG